MSDHETALTGCYTRPYSEIAQEGQDSGDGWIPGYDRICCAPVERKASWRNRLALWLWIRGWGRLSALVAGRD